MRFLKIHDFNGITGYQLGWSPAGPPMMTVYCFVLGNVMIDTAQSHMRKEALDIARNHRISRVYLTHYHEDHSGNAAAVRQTLQAGVYGHTETLVKMGARFSILPYQRYMWGKADSLEMDAVPDRIETVLGGMIPVHTPGHSKDHLVYFLEDQGVLFSGDLFLAEKIKYFRSDEDMGNQIGALKKVLDLDFQTLLCSHHPKRWNGKNHIRSKLAFLEDLYGGIVRLRQKGMTERRIFNELGLKEDYFAKYFCFGNVSMMNGVRSAVRHYENEKDKTG